MIASGEESIFCKEYSGKKRKSTGTRVGSNKQLKEIYNSWRRNKCIRK